MKKNIAVIIRFAKPYKFKFSFLLFCILLATFTGCLYPYIFSNLVDEVFFNKNLDVFLSIVIKYGIVYFLNQFMHFFINMIWASLMTSFLFDIRSSIFKTVMAYRVKKLINIYSGDIIYRMGTDVEQFLNFIHWNIFYSIASILNLVTSIGFILYINVFLGLFTIIFTPIIVYISGFFSKKVKKIYSEISQSNGRLFSWLFEILRGMQEIRIIGATTTIISNFVRKTIKILRLQITASKVEVVSERITSGISLLSQIIMYGVSAIFIYNGYMTVGGFTACITYFNTCINVFGGLNNRILSISNNMVSVERVISVLNESVEKYNDNSDIRKIEKGKIDIINVSFSYTDNIKVLKDVSININPGEIISLVGNSGAGKTTIANLLCRFYDVEQGLILIDNKNIKEYNLRDLRNQIGIVHQENIIFCGTIRYNISFSNDCELDDNIWEALKMSGLYDFVKSLPYKLDTIIGKNGVDFSGGQKQRLIISRVFYKDPKILIFDEATSSVDNESESIIRESWHKLCYGRTIIVIAHRLSTILNSNKIAVLEEGKIVGFNSHDILINECKQYKDMFKKQLFTKKEELNEEKSI